MMIQQMLSRLLAVCVLAAAAQAQQPAAPRAVVPLTAYAFGDIYKGETISQVFVIRNEGNADLLITDFVGTCGCELLGVDKVIAPGKEGRARVEVSTASQPGGKLYKSAILHTNDPEHPSFSLSLMANVLTSGNGGPVKGVELREGKHVGPVFVGPDAQNGFIVAPGKTASAEFRITVERGPLNIQRVESSGKLISARLETVEAGQQYKIVFENVPVAAEGTYQEELHAVTDNAALPILPLTVRIKVRRD
jgi:Protein of unknown function (DUF1573)